MLEGHTQGKRVMKGHVLNCESRSGTENFLQPLKCILGSVIYEMQCIQLCPKKWQKNKHG
jgi:hypothetical protein